MIKSIQNPMRSKFITAVAVICAMLLLSITLIGRADAAAPADYDVTVHSDASYGFDQPGASVVYDGHFFVANAGSGTITQMATATGAFVRLISGVSKPSFMTAYDGKLWISSYDTNKIYVVDIDSGTVIQTLTSPTFSCPSGIVPAGGKIWVAQNCAARISVLNTDGTIAASLSGSPYNFSWPFIITSDGTNVWVPNTGTTAVTKLNVTPTAGSYFAATYNNTNTPGASFNGLRQTLSDGVSFWTISNATKVITQIDIATGSLVRVLSGSDYQFNGFGLAVVYGDYLWIPNSSDNKVTVVNKSDGTVAAILSGSPYNFSQPSSSSVGDDAVWIPNYSNNTVTELHDLVAPTAPLNVSASGDIGSAMITWEAPASDGGLPITKYQYQLGSGSWTDAVGTSSPITISGLTNGTSYSIKLRAVNEAGDGAASDAVSVTPGPRPAAPTSLVATPGVNSASIAFTPGADGGSAITKYQYRVGNGSWTDAVGTTSPITISGLTNYQISTVRLRAVNAVGNSPASSPVSVIPRQAGPAVTTANPSGRTGIVVTFNPNPLPGTTVAWQSVVAYAEGTNTVAGSCRTYATRTTCFIGGLTRATTYDLRVTAHLPAVGKTWHRYTFEGSILQVGTNR